MAKTQPVTQAHFCRFQNIFFKYFLPLFKTSHNGGKKLLRSDEQKHGLQNTRRLPESMPHHTPSATVTVSAISKLPAHIPSNRNFCYKKKSAVQRVAVSKRSRAFLYQDRKIIKIVAKISGKTKVSLIKSKNARRDAQNCTV